MSYENEYKEVHHNRGLAGTALGLGAGAIGLELVRNGFGGLFGGGTNCASGYTRFDAEKDARIASLEADKKLLESNIYTDSKIADVYEKLNAKIGLINEELCTQRVFNATNTAALNCINGQIAQLMALTKLVIPASGICPAPMPMYNSWTAPTTTTGTAGG